MYTNLAHNVFIADILCEASVWLVIHARVRPDMTGLRLIARIRYLEIQFVFSVDRFTVLFRYRNLRLKIKNAISGNYMLRRSKLSMMEVIAPKEEEKEKEIWDCRLCCGRSLSHGNINLTSENFKLVSPRK